MRTSLAFSPGDLPAGKRLMLFPPGTGNNAREIVTVVRPDVILVDDVARRVDTVVLTSPDWREQLATVERLKLADEVIVLPEVATSYYDWWSFPLDLIERSPHGQLCVRYPELLAFVAGLGEFFGSWAADRFVHSSIRYQPFERIASPARKKLKEEVLAQLSDDDSRDDLSAVLIDEPIQLWKRWLSRVFDGLEYMDYILLQPGDVVFNCGVHGGGEIPYFLGSLAGEGRLVNIDPLGHDYLSAYTRESLAAWPNLWTEQRIALHDTEANITLPVEEGGMAAGGRVGEQIEGLDSINCRATSIDIIVEELGLARLDLIKMDIEGAEPRALAGACQSMRRFRPQLAISIYHQPEHFLEIPAQVSQIVDGYDFFVKNYHFISNETILYGIPKERPRRWRKSQVSVKLTNED